MLTFKSKQPVLDYSKEKLRVNSDLHHLELEVEGSVAFIVYKLSRGTLFLIHTEVPSALQGKGVGNTIVQKALQYAKDNKYEIVPICPFVQSYLKRHKEWNSIVSPDAERFIYKH